MKNLLRLVPMTRRVSWQALTGSIGTVCTGDSLIFLGFFWTTMSHNEPLFSQGAKYDKFQTRIAKSHARRVVETRLYLKTVVANAKSKTCYVAPLANTYIFYHKPFFSLKIKA